MDLKLKKDNPPVFEGSGLVDLQKLNIIIGKNGSGKTRFLEGLIRDFSKEYNFIPIKANNVIPSNDAMKTSAASSSLIKDISKLFENLNITPVLKNEPDIKSKVSELIKKTNENFADFTGDKTIKIKNDLSGGLGIAVVIQAILSDFFIEEDGVEKPYKIDASAQGHQRLFIASILKTYIDLGKKYGFKDSLKENILFFEEPELFLHPKLKKELNYTLNKIAEDNNQTIVIISTHDPYFVYSNTEKEDVKIFSFVKESGRTNIKIGHEEQSEIIDELTHILLFNKMFEKMEKKDQEKYNLGPKMEDTSLRMKEILNDSSLENERNYNYKDNGTEYKVLLPIYIRNTLHHKHEPISHEDLELSIKIMSKILSNLS
jgi:ABC-type lipoprotein export system ATPase subunit